MENKDDKVVDLVNLYKTDNSQFLKLFEESHKIYIEAFPKHEQETKNQILNYIKKPVDSRGVYNYIVPVVDGVAKGMHSFDFISNNERDLVGHLGPLTIGKDARGKGLSSLLVNEIFEKTKDYANQEQLNPLGLIGEVNFFDSPEEVNKYGARLRFHHKHLGFGAAVTIDKDNYAKLIPHASPGIMKNGQSAEIMPFIMAITPFVDGSVKKISTSPGEIISSLGKVLVEKDTLQKISSKNIMKMQGIIFKDYSQSPEIYNSEQISSIVDDSEKVLNYIENIYLIPIMDTRYLK